MHITLGVTGLVWQQLVWQSVNLQIPLRHSGPFCALKPNQRPELHSTNVQHCMFLLLSKGIRLQDWIATPVSRCEATPVREDFKMGALGQYTAKTSTRHTTSGVLTCSRAMGFGVLSNQEPFHWVSGMDQFSKVRYQHKPNPQTPQGCSTPLPPQPHPKPNLRPELHTTNILSGGSLLFEVTRHQDHVAKHPQNISKWLPI